MQYSLNMKIMIGLLFFCIGAAASSAFANVGVTQARAMSLGGAYTCLALGADAPLWNPANLSSSPKDNVSVNLVAFGAFLKNDSFAKREYDRYNGAYLDTNAKEHILSLVPSSGLNIDTGVGVQALSLAYGPLAFSNSVAIGSKSRFAREFFELMFFGNEVGRTYDFKPTAGDAIAYSSFAISYGRKLKFGLPWLTQEGVGISLKYLRGFGFGEVAHASAKTVTEKSGAAFQGSALMRYASGGNGYGVDIAFAGVLFHKYRVGIVFENAPASIRWSKGTEETFAEFHGDSLTVESLSDVDIDSVIVHRDSVYAVAPFSKPLPFILRLGVARKLGDFIVAFDYQQSFRETSLADKTPRVVLGTEWRRWRYLRLRSGITVGGYAGFAVSWGLGLAAGSVFFDVAVRTYNSPMPVWAKGVALATTLRLWF